MNRLSRKGVSALMRFSAWTAHRASPEDPRRLHMLLGRRHVEFAPHRGNRRLSVCSTARHAIRAHLAVVLVNPCNTKEERV